MSVIDEVRDWVGSIPDDTGIHDALNRYGHDPHRAALSILRRRQADMAANPARWAVVDDYSQDTTENLRAVRALITALEDIVGGESTGPAGLSAQPIVGPNLNIR